MCVATACYCGCDVLHVGVGGPCAVFPTSGLPTPQPVVVGGVVVDVLVAEVAITPELHFVAYVQSEVWF